MILVNKILSIDFYGITIDPKSKGFIKLKKPKKIRKVILCSGKIYFDLLEAREKLKVDDILFFRIEQLYPFPAKSLAKELKVYAKNAQFCWCQEEPQNMGAWFSVRDYIQWTLDNICLLYTSPSPRDLSTSRMPSSA